MSDGRFPDNDKAVPIPGESSPKENNDPLCEDYDESNTGSLVQTSMQLTEGIKNLQRENDDLRAKVQELSGQKYGDPDREALKSHR